MLAELYYRFKLPLFNWREERSVCQNFYHDAVFKKLDQELLDSPNPYPIAKVFPYGETPLSILYQVGKELNLQPSDHFVDLGCGRGRAVFFMSHMFGCRATGVDLTPSFITRAQKLTKSYKRENVRFLCQDFFNYDLNDATCIYLYGTCYENVDLKRLQFPKGAHLITVSEPLFTPHRAKIVQFPWGRSAIFLHDT